MLRRGAKRKLRRRQITAAKLVKTRCNYCQRPVLEDGARRTLSHLAPACSTWLAAMRVNRSSFAMLVTQ